MLQQVVRTYSYNVEKCKTYMGEAYSILLGQYDDVMTQQLATYDEWPAVEDRCDPIDLLKLLQRICYDFKQEQFPVMAELNALQKLFRMKQGKDESLTDMLEIFADLVEVADSCVAITIGIGVRDYVANREKNLKYSKCTSSVQKELDPIIASLAKATLFLMLAGVP